MKTRIADIQTVIDDARCAVEELVRAELIAISGYAQPAAIADLLDDLQRAQGAAAVLGELAGRYGVR